MDRIQFKLTLGLNGIIVTAGAELRREERSGGYRTHPLQILFLKTTRRRSLNRTGTRNDLIHTWMCNALAKFSAPGLVCY